MIFGKARARIPEYKGRRLAVLEAPHFNVAVVAVSLGVSAEGREDEPSSLQLRAADESHDALQQAILQA